MTSSPPTHACSQPHRATCVSCPQIPPHQLCALGLQRWPVPLPEILHGHLPHFLQVFIQVTGLSRKLCLELHTARVSPGCPVVRTHRFHCWGLGSITGWGTKIPQTVWQNIYIYIYIYTHTHTQVNPTAFSPSPLLRMAFTTYYLFIVCLYQSLNLSTLIYHKYHTGLVNERMKE